MSESNDFGWTVHEMVCYTFVCIRDGNERYHTKLTTNFPGSVKLYRIALDRLKTLCVAAVYDHGAFKCHRHGPCM